MNWLIWIAPAVITVLAVVWFLHWQNNSIRVSNYRIGLTEETRDLDGITLVQVSDLHNKRFGRHDEQLLRQVRLLSPSYLCVTGDLIDGRNPDLVHACDIMEQLLSVAPVLFVPGNHEARYSGYDELRTRLKRAGVLFPNEAPFSFYRGKAQLLFIGLADPLFYDSPAEYPTGHPAGHPTGHPAGHPAGQDKTDPIALHQLRVQCRFADPSHTVTVLLAHHPEKIGLYAQAGVSLALVGHAHGGQIRLPWIGGLFAPSQGWFPKYTAGIFRREQTKMIVSRGLGPSIFPFRIGNRPELVAVTFCSRSRDQWDEGKDRMQKEA